MNTSDIAVIDSPTPGSNLPRQQPSFSGTGFSGAMVEVWQKNGSLLGQPVSVQNNRWSIPLTDIAAGTTTFAVSVRQTLGGVTSEWRDFSFIVVDTPTMKASDVAVIDSPPPGSNLPRQAPSLSGTGFSGAKVEIWQKSGSLLAQGPVQNNRWSLPFADIAAGLTTFTVSVRQIFGNVISEWRDFSFTVVDPPAMKTTDVAVIDTPAPDSNLPRQTPLLSGTGFPGAMVEIWQKSGSRLGQGPVQNNNRWTIPLADLAAGTTTLTVSVHQILGGVISEWRDFSFAVVDTPTMKTSDVAIIDTPTLGSNLSRQAPLLSGTGFPGAMVEIWQKNGGRLGQGLVQNNRWTIPLADLAPGTTTFAFSVRQILGAVTSEWRDFSFTVVDTPVMKTSDVAVIDTPPPGSTLPRQRPSLSGTGFFGATVEVWQKSGSRLGQGPVQNNNRWTIPLADLAPGTTTFTFSVRQIFGAVTSEWRDFSFSVADTSTMKTSDVAVIDTPIPGSTLPRQAPSLSGTGFSGATVQIWQKSGSRLAQELVQNNRWRITLADLAPGTTTLTVSVRQVLGNLISEWRDFSFTVADMRTSDVAVIDTPPPGSNLPGQQPSLSGTGFPGATVEIWQKNGSRLAQGLVQNNRWRITLADLAPGTTTLTVSVRQVLGNVVSEWRDFSFTVVADTPAMKTSDVAVIDTPPPGCPLTRQTPSLSGTGFPGATVEIWQKNSSLLAQGSVQNNNRWRITLADLAQGTTTFTVSIRQVLGNMTSEWRDFSFTVQEYIAQPGPDIDYDSLLKNEIVNTTNKKENYVDPRTGLFNAYFSIASLTANAAQGPNLDIDFFYRPYSFNAMGIGVGWKLRLSSYNLLYKTLTLSTGVSIAKPNDIDPRETLRKYGFILGTADENNEYGQPQAIQIYHKDGSIEKLNFQGYNNVLLPSQIITTHGFTLYIHWENQRTNQGIATRIMSIRDEKNLLLDVSYHENDAIFTVWPNTPEQYSVVLNFNTASNTLSSVTFPDSSTPSNQSFYYEPNPTLGSILTTVTSSSGLRENVIYNSSGVTVNNKTLPWVTQHTLTPGGRQPEIITTYNYTKTSSDSYITTSTNRTSEQVIVKTFSFEKNLLISEAQTINECSATMTYEYRGSAPYLNKTRYENKTTGAFRQGPTKQSLFSPDGNVIYSDTDGTPTRWTYASASTSSTSQRFNLPVIIEYPIPFGDYSDNIPSDSPLYSNVVFNASERHIESEYSYRTSPNGSFPDLIRKFYSYTRLPKKQPSLTAGNLRPSLCLTIYTPDSSGGSSLGKWKNGSMILEKIEYIKDPSSPHHGRVQSMSTEILDARGNTVPNSKYITRFSYDITDAYLKKTTEVVSSEGISNTTEETTSIFSGRLIKLVDTLKNTTEYIYDSLGRTLRKTQNSQNNQYRQTTDYQYIQTSTGPSVVTTSNTGVKQWIKSDALQRPISTEIWTDITGFSQWLTVTSTQYDALGREEKTVLYDYLANGSVLSSWTETHYDNWGNPNKSIVNNEKTIYSNYDPISNTLENWIEFGGTPCGKTLTTYNPSGEITLVTNADISGNIQASQSYQYDNFQRLTAQTNKTRSLSNSLDTTYTYDNFGRPSTITSGNKTITYSYPNHTAENVVAEISILDQSNRSSYSLGQQNYDSLNRLIRSASGGRTYTFTYATSSNSATTATLPDAREISFEYQAELNNKLIKQSVRSSGQQQAYTYQTVGNPFETASRTPGTFVNRNYNANGFLLTEKLSNLNTDTDKSSTYQYSLNGLLTSETDFFGNKTTYHYNQNGRYIGSSSPTITVRLSHDNSGLLIKEEVNDAESGTTMTIAYTYDENHRETSRVFSSAGFPTLKIAYNYQSDWSISDITFSRDNALIRKEVFTYLPSGQLQACSYSGTECPVDPWGNALTAQSFTYDQLDNILTCTSQFGTKTNIASYHYDNPYDKTQLSSITNTHPTYPNQIILEYDSAGRVTKDEAGRTLSYDSLGQLKEIFSANQGIALTYTYDAYNRIAGTKSALRTQNFFYKGSSIFAQSESIFSVNQGKTHSITNSQLNSSNACCAQVKSDLDYTTGVTQTVRFMELKDPHGSLIASYDITNKTASYFSYTPHGYRPLNNNNRSFLGFNGEPMDSVTGLYHLGNGYRAYNPITLHFHLPDSQSPFGAGGINSYSYCSDPINYSDPTGHASYRINPRYYHKSSINHGSLISTILWGGVAIMAAIPTGGTSLLLGGALLGTEIVATSFGIASALTERSNPKLSEQLGWASLGLGLSSIAYGSFRAGKTIYSAASDFRRAASLSTEHLGQAKKITQTMGGPIEKIKLHEGNLTLTQESFKGGKRLTFNAHGAIPPGEESALMRVGENFIGPAEAIDLARNLGYDIKNYDYVRLIMCHSADGGNASFAQTLSTLTRKPVKAFIGKIDVSWVADEVGKHSNRQERLAMYIGKKYEIVTPTHKKIIGFNEQGSFAFGNTDEYNSIRVNFFPR
ncbi:RHS repeat-associated core domain-containing protein [Pseudomonas sp. MWU12-2037]|uniref:RHS repeat-associated core domain-containing protein n=1 Tax=Pseudomonas sp. MWU12-2037 TaxID=2928690 RepID=UPI00200F2A46|nr:RHS repeat-associated core domain-containing protein [Pseudomonas sp. MWU12-2037]